MMLVLLAAGAVAGTRETHGFRYRMEPDLDGWTVVHFASGVGLQKAYTKMGMSGKTALALSIISGYAYEVIFDGYGNNAAWWRYDRRGADLIGDPLWVALGAYLEYRMNGRAVTVKVKKNKIEVEIRL